jgi:ribokinase
MTAGESIVVVGDTFVDLICRVPRVPAAGGAVLGSTLSPTGGGAGGNMAVTAALLGLDVVFVTAVGDDDYGRLAVEEYRTVGIDCGRIAVREGVPTSAAILLIDRAAERTIIGCADGAAGDYLLVEDLAATVAAPPDHLLLSGLMMSAETTGRTLVALAAALPAGTTLYFDPNPRLQPQDVTDEIRERYQAVATRADVLLAGDDELEMLGLARRPGQVLVRKAGAAGSTVVTDAGSVHIPAHQVAVVNSTGAGDAYAAAYVAATVRGAGPPEAARLASAAGALAVMSPGSRSDFDWQAVVSAAGEERMQ